MIHREGMAIVKPWESVRDWEFQSMRNATAERTRERLEPTSAVPRLLRLAAKPVDSGRRLSDSDAAELFDLGGELES